MEICEHRGVAQLGSALLWGSRGRGFKSRRSDSMGKARQIYLAFNPNLTECRAEFPIPL